MRAAMRAKWWPAIVFLAFLYPTLAWGASATADLSLSQLRSEVARLQQILNDLYLKLGVLNQVVKPQITSISPFKGGIGTKITIKGKGFLPKGNTIYTGYDRVAANSADGETLSFTLSPPFLKSVSRSHFTFDSIPFHFYVGNKNGVSAESSEFLLTF